MTVFIALGICQVFNIFIKLILIILNRQNPDAMDQEFQEVVMTSVGLAASIIGAIVIICLCYEKRKMDLRLKQARRRYANHLILLELLEKELDRRKNNKAIFIYPISEN